MAKADDEDRAGDLLIQEVDEDLRNEQLLNFAKRYGVLVAAALILLVVGVGGWEGWKAWQAHQQEKAAANYAAAVALLDDGKTKDAEDALAKIPGDDPGFAALAGMRRAALLAQNGDTKGAMAAYQQLADSGVPKVLRDLATIKEGLLALAAEGDMSPVEARLGAVAVAGNPWQDEATELLALFAHKKGDDTHALQMFKQLADDPQATAGVRARAAEMIAALGPTAPAAANSAPAAPGATAPAETAKPAATPPAQDKK